MNASSLDLETKTQIVNDLADFTLDPYGFVLYSFPWGEGDLAGRHIEDWQRTTLIEIGAQLRAGKISGNQVVREAIASGHGIGKGALFSWLCLWALSTFEDSVVVVTANTETQLKTKTWAQLAKWYRMFIGRHMFTLTATALYSTDPEHEKTWRADMVPWSDARTESFAGMHNQGKRILLAFDEASSISDQIWDVSEGALTDKDTEIIWIAQGNPTRNSGRFKECFTTKRARWNCHQVDSREVSITNKEQIAEWVADYGADSDFVRVRVRGLFPSSGDLQFISNAIVDAAYGREIHVNQYQFAPVVIGVDPAWDGGDKTAIVMRQGIFSKVLMVILRNDDDNVVAGHIAKFQDKYEAKAVFIDQGYGTGIYSAGKAMGRQWTLVPFGAKASRPGIGNKRVEMWDDMRMWLRDGGMIEKNRDLYNEITAPDSKPKADGTMMLESKKEMKARGVPSPNLADALALTFAHPVVNSQPVYSNGFVSIKKSRSCFRR